MWRNIWLLVKGKIMINYDEKFEKLGIKLDKPSSPAANYIPYTITGNLIFRTVCNTQGNEKNFITLPTGRNASNFGIEAATTGKVFFGVGVEGGAPVWTTADGKAAFDALHLTSTTPSPNGKYVIKIDPVKSDPGVRVTVSFIDHP